MILWVGAVWRLTAAGVRNSWHRAVALVFVYPLIVLGAIVVPVLLAMIVTNGFVSRADRLPVYVLFAAVLIGTLIIGATWWAGRFVRKMMIALGQHREGTTELDVDSQDHRNEEPE